MDFYRFCIILKFIDISKNILVQNPDKGPLRFTPLDSTQHCTGGPPSLILVRHPMVIILYSRHAPPQSAAAPRAVASSRTLWSSSSGNNANFGHRPDTQGTHNTQDRQLKTTVLLDPNQRRFWSPLLICLSDLNVMNMSMQNYVTTYKRSDIKVKSHLH